MQTQTRCQRLLRRVAERRQPLVQPPRGQHSSPGVIFLGQWGAKYCQKARTGHVVDNPAIAVDHLLGQSEQGAHLAVERIQARLRLNRCRLGQGTP